MDIVAMLKQAAPWLFAAAVLAAFLWLIVPSKGQLAARDANRGKKASERAFRRGFAVGAGGALRRWRTRRGQGDKG